MQRAVRLRQLPRQRQHERDGQLRHRDGIRARRVHHHDAAPRRRIGIDVVHPHTRAANHPQLRRVLQERIVHLHRRAHHQPIGILQLVRKSILDLVMRHHVPARLGLEDGERGRRHFFCENNLQNGLLYRFQSRRGDEARQFSESACRFSSRNSVHANLIVGGERFHSGKQPPGLRFKLGNGIIRTCKLLHGLKRIEEIHHDKFNLLRHIAAQHVSTAIAGDLLQARQNSAAKQLLVRSGILGRGPASPMACNHPYLAAASSGCATEVRSAKVCCAAASALPNSKPGSFSDFAATCSSAPMIAIVSR